MNLELKGELNLVSYIPELLPCSPALDEAKSLVNMASVGLRRDELKYSKC